MCHPNMPVFDIMDYPIRDRCYELPMWQSHIVTFNIVNHPDTDRITDVALLHTVLFDIVNDPDSNMCQGILIRHAYVSVFVY